MYQGNQANLPVRVRSDYLVWSICNMIFFFPWIVFWLPALILSIVSRSKRRSQEIESANQLAKASLGLNITCTVLGALAWIAIVIAVPIILTRVAVPASSSSSMLSSSLSLSSSSLSSFLG